MPRDLFADQGVRAPRNLIAADRVGIATKPQAAVPDFRSQILDAAMRANPLTAGAWTIGKHVMNPDVQAAFGRDMSRLGSSLADAISLSVVVVFFFFGFFVVF